MAKFKEKLEQFALKHKKDINKNPQLRQEFNQMCAKIGVDPLATHKGFWAQLLGVGDFYYELAIQIVDISLKTREINGGLISIREVLQRLNKLRGASAQQISKDDIERAVQKLKVLGEGFKILHIGAKRMLQTVPGELNNDQTSIILMAQNKGYVTIAEVTKELSWDAARVEYALVSS
jgi:ESCRT-II complex subunit VPS22